MVSIIAVGAFLKFTPNSLLCSRRLKSRSRCRNIHLGHMIPPPPPQVLKVNSLRVFSLGFVIAGRSFLPVGMEKGQSIFSAALVGKQSYSSAFESSVPAPSSVYSSAGIELTASCSSGDKELYHSSHSRVSSVKSDLLNDCPLNSMVPLEPISPEIGVNAFNKSSPL